MDNIQIVRIKQLNPDIIPPSTSTMYNSDQGGSKIVIIGKPGTGKTTLIASLLYQKRNIFPIGLVMSGTEDSNGYYKTLFPSTFVYNKLEETKISDFISRQKIAKKHLTNPWGVLLLDDCTDDPKLFNKPLFHSLYKNGRHWKMWYILSLQYSHYLFALIQSPSISV